MNPAPPTLDAPSGTRHLLPAMRVLLGAFAVLTALATVALFVLAGSTEQTFAWTIQPPLTAAFLGAGYAAGFVLVVLSLRARSGRTPGAGADDLRVRRADPRGHAAAPRPAALRRRVRRARARWRRRPAWFWLAVYVVVPVAMLVLLVRAGARAGRRPAARHPVPRVAAGRARPSSRRCCSSSASLLYVAPTTATTALAVGADARSPPGSSPPGCSPSGWPRRWPRSPATCAGCARRPSPTRSSACWCWSRCCGSRGTVDWERPAGLAVPRHGRRRGR